jgi:hypothetical protein
MQLPRSVESGAVRASRRRLGRASWLALAMLAAAVGCGDDKKDGGLAVVVESDLSMPKDIDRVRFVVSQDGLTLRTEDHLVGEGQLLMPAEFRVKPVDKSNPVLIRAIGLKGGINRIERSVITTVPSSFVAMVRLPLTYLCAGTAREDGSSTCGDGQTCKLGVCQAAAMDSSTLPVYQPGPWTGSENGSRDPTASDCFDVLNCFSQAYRVDLDRNTCTFVVDNDDPANISVGIKLPQGSDGICGAGSCWIALDQGAEGWTNEGTIFKLPDALCRDQSDGSKLVIVASNMCGGKTLSTPPCGTWSSATHPADTSESIGTTEEGVMETPGDPVGASCAGLSFQPCGDCGQQRRTCMNGKWSDWGQCLGQGVCTPNASEMCGSDGMRVCLNTCDWDDCTGQTCVGNAVEACGNCGTRRRTCTNGEWSEWGECENSGQCAPGTTQACGVGGTQACMGNCQWGTCGTEVCPGAPSQACGNCGTQARTCDAETKQWSEFGACGQEGACEANQTRACGLRGMQTCGGNCQWDPSCTGQVCEGPASQPCGMCGVQTRTCDSTTGLWSAWGECMAEGVCAPGTTAPCGVGGARVCLNSCVWSEECTGQLCSGPMTESCGNCGTRSRECDDLTATWKPWGACTNTGPCNPGSTRRCGSGGTQTCTATCQWPTTCLGQSCSGESTRACLDCGTQSRICNGSTGLYGEWGSCTGQGPCTPGDVESCGALKERVCQDTCQFDQCHCVAGATECGDLCVNLKTDSQHCGSCNRNCNGLACNNGTCATCPSGRHNCNGECVLNTDPDSCGPTSCTPCRAPANGTATCEAAQCDFTCNPGYHRCGNECFSNLLDNYCGNLCNTECPPPEGGTARCDNGMCVQMCPSGGSTGTDTNCSRCGDQCMAGERCINGACSCPGGGQVGEDAHCSSCTDRCMNGTECLSGSCRCANGKPLGDNSNCGACDKGCPAGEMCKNGATCGCADGDLGDNKNCGSCGKACAPGETCKGTRCGCESGDLGDDKNCGSCGNACPPGQMCKGTSCGCESGSLGDENNCGSCGNKCSAPTNATPKCTATGCDFDCDPGYHRCGNACFSNNLDGYCGARCNEKCPAVEGGIGMCKDGVCIEVCQSGGMTGTKTDCSSCGDMCTLGSDCINGRCLCDDDRPVGTDRNCARCGDQCTNGARCTNGACQCESGQLGDDNNCGTCGTKCTDGRECRDNACACAVGVLGDDNNCGSCGTRCSNGRKCEANACVCADGMLGDDNNCGTCGTRCTDGRKCEDNACVCADGVLGDDNNCGSCGARCSNGEKCQNNSCACPDGKLNDVNNCGTCGNVCEGEAPACNGGKCGCAATACGARCEVCGSNETCIEGSCTPSQPSSGQSGGGEVPAGQGGMGMSSGGMSGAGMNAAGMGMNNGGMNAGGMNAAGVGTNAGTNAGGMNAAGMDPSSGGMNAAGMNAAGMDPSSGGMNAGGMGARGGSNRGGNGERGMGSGGGMNTGGMGMSSGGINAGDMDQRANLDVTDMTASDVSARDMNALDVSAPDVSARDVDASDVIAGDNVGAPSDDDTNGSPSALGISGSALRSTDISLTGDEGVQRQAGDSNPAIARGGFGNSMIGSDN